MDGDPNRAFRTLLAFLDRLEEAKITDHLEQVRASIMICAAVPGERWEIECFVDGHVEIERFVRTDGVTREDDELNRFISTYGVEQEGQHPGASPGATAYFLLSHVSRLYPNTPTSAFSAPSHHRSSRNTGARPRVRTTRRLLMEL
ncbi:MAG: hypothetical protein ACR2JY_00910 [Chloroflexota bacterium]